MTAKRCFDNWPYPSKKTAGKNPRPRFRSGRWRHEVAPRPPGCPAGGAGDRMAIRPEPPEATVEPHRMMKVRPTDHPEGVPGARPRHEWPAAAKFSGAE